MSSADAPREHRAQIVLARGDKDRMDVIVHQAPGKATRPARPRALGDQGEIGLAVVVVEEDRQPAVAALGDVVRDTGKDEAGKTGQPATPIRCAGGRQLCIVSPEFPVGVFGRDEGHVPGIAELSSTFNATFSQRIGTPIRDNYTISI